MEIEPNQHNINNVRIEAIADKIAHYYQSLPLPDFSRTGETTEFAAIINKRRRIFDYILKKYHVSEPERSRLNDVLAKKTATKKKNNL